MTETTSGTPPRVTTLDILASSTLLFALAVALPLLDLLGRNAAFFVVRDSPASDIVGLALVVTILLPLLLAGVAIVAGRIQAAAGVWIHGAIFVVLGALLALSIIRQTPLGDLAGWTQIGIALAAATFLYRVYLRFSTLRLGVRWTWIAPLAVLGLFLFGSSASRLIVGSAAAATESAEVGNPAPVVFLVFDALSISDLMDGNGDLQDDLYPNFARLARDGTWYRNAITLHPSTEKSVPAILTGLVSREDQVPLLSDHPNNLFTLLDGTYEINATEPIAKLCPEEACDGQPKDRFATIGRWRGLFSDIRVIAGHLFLPEDLAAGLPPIDDTWGGFDGAAPEQTGEDTAKASGEFDVREEFWVAVAQDRRESIANFIESIDAREGLPTFDFLHALVPHAPWTFLSTGQRNDLPEGRLSARSTPDGWVDDPWMIEQVRQLHLIQVQYVDTLLGSILDRLDALGTYDESLIVVIADHGETFRPGLPRQRDRAAVIDDVLPIPLFIKAPHQEVGVIDDYRAYTTDVLPSIAEMLDIDLPWAIDGTSLISDERPSRNTSEVMTVDGMVEFPSDFSVARSHARERIERFGAEGPFGLAPVGYAELLGTDVSTLQLDDPFPAKVSLRDPGRWNDVDTGADVLPVFFRGRIDGFESSEVVIAIALNGRIVAVTRSYLDANGDTHFDALLPPDALRDGLNELDLLVVSGVGAERTFHPIG